MIYLHDLVKKANMTYAKHIFLNMGAAINAFNFFFFWAGGGGGGGKANKFSDFFFFFGGGGGGGGGGGKSIKFSDIIFHLGDFHIRKNFKAEFYFYYNVFEV